MNIVKMIDENRILKNENEKIKNDIKNLENNYKTIKEKLFIQSSPLGKIALDLLCDNVFVIKQVSHPNRFYNISKNHILSCNTNTPSPTWEIQTTMQTIELKPVFKRIDNNDLYLGMVGKCEETGNVYIWYNPKCYGLTC